MQILNKEKDNMNFSTSVINADHALQLVNIEQTCGKEHSSLGFSNAGIFRTTESGDIRSKFKHD